MKRLHTVVGSLSVLCTGLGGWALARHRAPPAATQRLQEAARCPEGFVYVPGGECWIGSNDPDADEDVRPRQRVFVRSFYLSRCEVSQAEWKRFKPEFRIAPGKEAYPVTAITLEEAAAYCRFVGGRLPSELEWEKAARGPDGRRFPWGDEFDPVRVNLRGTSEGARARSAETATGATCGVRSRLRPVDAFPEGASPYGALNMAGNAWEWVSDAFRGDPKIRIIRGGAAGYWERDARTYHRALEGAGVT